MKTITWVIYQRSEQFLIERLHEKKQQTLNNVDDKTRGEVRNCEANVYENGRFYFAHDTSHS